MFCCPECFSDRTLRSFIFSQRETTVGQCSYCGSTAVLLIDPRVLREYFELLVSVYRPAEDGKVLIEWFKDDWGLFDHPAMDLPRSQSLLAEILDNGEVVRQHFEPAFAPIGNRLGEWEEFRNELRYKNRFFPEVDFDQDRLASLLTLLEPEANEVPTTWFRARLRKGAGVYTDEEMGAPPCELATHGRANPAGIPYLYVASSIVTAISEARPQTGQIAYVAEFSFIGDLRLIDLRTPKKTVSPFVFDEPADIGRMRNEVPFLESLGEELTRPVIQSAAATDYTPSQYLCEFIKSKRYDGVIYRSSVSTGINLAVFNTHVGRCGTIRQYSVGTVTVEFTELGNT